jgi:hypothetical protein
MQWPLLVLLLFAIAGIYVFFVSAGTGNQIASQSWYFEKLSDAFLDGHTYLRVRPAPQLLAKANPYDPAHARFWLWDATLHEGRYYLYWGPLPALLAAAVKSVAGRGMAIPDGVLVLAFVLGRLAVGTAILVLALRWLFPRLPPWHAAPAVAVFGLANPYLYGLGRVAVYEAAIEGAQCFLLTGLLMGLLSLRGAGSRRRQLVLGCLAGCAWGAALACRISVMFAVGALVPLTAWMASWGASPARREFVLRLVWIGAPVAFALFWLGVYNDVRFGSWTDFGAAHQLGYLPYSFSILRFPSTLHAYLLKEVMVSCRFPFVFAPAGASAMPPDWMFARQTGYLSLEPVVGMLIAVPCVLFGAVAVWASAGFWMRRLAAPPGSGIEPRDRLYHWLVTACLAVTLLAGAPALGMQFSTMRFLADFTSSALVLAAIGFWTLVRSATSAGRRRAVHAAGALLALYTVLFSILIGFQGGYYLSFERTNPALLAQLEERFSFCE